MYNSRINDNRVNIKVKILAVELFKEKDNDLAITKNKYGRRVICSHLGNLKTWSSQIRVVYENWLL